MTGKDKGWPATEIADQVEATRKQKGATGNVHFSMKPLMTNRGGVADALEKVVRRAGAGPGVAVAGRQEAGEA